MKKKLLVLVVIVAAVLLLTGCDWLDGTAASPTLVPSSSTPVPYAAVGEMPADGVDWISPGQVEVGNFKAGNRAEWPISIHNGGEEVVSFLVYYLTPAYATEGYSVAPPAVQNWVSFSDTMPTLLPKETREVLVVLEMPSGVVVDSDRWEFWVGVANGSQSGMIRTELASKWLVSMR